MDKRISAAFVVMLFVLGIVAVPVSAHFTLGEHIGTYRFRRNDFDPHVKGLMGYIWPGAGLWTGPAPGLYYGAPGYPGYQSPWPGQMPGPGPWGGVAGPEGWYQLESNNYAPFGAILTSTIKAGTPFKKLWYGNPTVEGLDIEHAVKGDLILAFNVTASQKREWRLGTTNPFTGTPIAHATGDVFGGTWPFGPNSYSDWSAVTAINFTMAEILIPPEFTGVSAKKVVASWTNNYDNVGVSLRRKEDSTYGPGWRRLRVYTDSRPFLDPAGYDWADDWQTDWQYSSTVDKADDAPDSWLQPNGPLGFSPWKTFGNITFRIMPLNPNDRPEDWVFTDEWYYIRINDVTAPTIAGQYFFKFRRLYCADPVNWSPRRARYVPGSVSFPVENWPVLCVKGEVDPAIISGTLRIGGWNTTHYGWPLEVTGRVRAVGIADDPYTGKSTGRPVEARGYFNDTSRGHYEVEGVAPGVYDIYASGAGFPELRIATNVKILKGQSYHIDGYLTPGVQIRGTVFSKCGTGEVPWSHPDSWGNIKIEIYKSLEDAMAALPASTVSDAVTWSPYSVGATTWRGTARLPDHRVDTGWSFPFFERTDPNGLTTGLENPHGTGSGYYADAYYRCRSTTGVGPPQHWNVLYGRTPSSFDFQFGRKGLYGAPSDLDGHVPRRTAIWINGLGAGTYFVRAWLYEYVQTKADGVTFEPVSFTVPSVEWPGNIYIPFDLRLSSEVMKEVHFHDVPGTMMESPIGWGWTFPWISTVEYFRTLAGELLDAAGKRVAWGISYTPTWATNRVVSLGGFRECGTYYGWGRNYGIPAGTYTSRAYMWGYVEQVTEKVTLGLCGTNTYISDHLYRGASFNISVYSKDWQFPTADKTWTYPYMPIYLQISDEKGKLLTPSTSQWIWPMAMQGFGNTSVAVWPYLFNNPFMMIETHDAFGVVYGQNEPQYPFYKHDYFGPVPADNRWNFRKYDGADHQSFVFAYWGEEAYGEGYTVGNKPLAFESGVYSFNALTYGYVQKKIASVGVTKGNSTADILIKLTQGAEFDLTIKFKHQGVFEPLMFDAMMRVRIFDDAKKLVGEYLTSDWWWQPQFDSRVPRRIANRVGEYHWETIRWDWNLVPTTNPYACPGVRCSWTHVQRNTWRLNYIPAGTSTVRVVIAGLPDMYGWVGAASPDPAFDMGFEGNAIAAPYGIDAMPNYKGAYRVEVDIVPTGTVYLGWFTLGLQGADTPLPWQYPPWLYTQWYPPFCGSAVLTGESEKYIPENHFGPMELRYDVVIPGTHLGGESSMIFELDRRGKVEGPVIGYTYCDDWRSTSWTTVQFTAADGKIYNYYTLDGSFAGYLPSGPYTMAVIFWSPAKQEGYKVFTAPFQMSDGATASFSVFLEQSGVPIPEFPVAAIVLASALAASLFVLRRRRKQ